jgi:hypothetical protein
MRNMAVSAVESLTTLGVLDNLMPRFEQARTST